MGFYFVPYISITAQKSLNWVIFISRNEHTTVLVTSLLESLQSLESFSQDFVPVSDFMVQPSALCGGWWKIVLKQFCSVSGDPLTLISHVSQHMKMSFFFLIRLIFLTLSFCKYLIFSLFQSMNESTRASFLSLYSLEFSSLSSFIFLYILYDG